ncbi:ABC-2 type transporter-domain-containing protein [Chaetomium sp. MPI-CAGE-AT-0009]|nr:ABC-2 type transporter-domain-containing protein [Chaetomium sp. MPI-CAGE-AT-0009]
MVSDEVRAILLRQATQRSTFTSGEAAEDDEVDPRSPRFNLGKWLRLQLRGFEVQGVGPLNTGVAFTKLSVYGDSSVLQVQHTVASAATSLRPSFLFAKGPARKTILHSIDGCLGSGEMLLVLGRPGAGCSTFLKSVAGELHGLALDETTRIHFNGISQDMMKARFRGDLVYNPELEIHFPHLTVAQTLEFAVASRTPRLPQPGETRKQRVGYIRDVLMAIFGLSHTANTKVGSDNVRGVSGGERKRVSLAEMSVDLPSVCCWDNATRGLDASSSLAFVRSLRTSANVFGGTHLIALYQASQLIYNTFDKVLLLYEGRAIYFGSTSRARAYFADMGWLCQPRQTTPDFLTAITNPSERIPRPGFESFVPRTPEDFERHWLRSSDYESLTKEMNEYEERFPPGGPEIDRFKGTHRLRQSPFARGSSPYIISMAEQVEICIVRCYRRLWNDKSSTATTFGGQLAFALIIGSIFYGMPFGTQSLRFKASAMFFAILLNSLLTESEITMLYDQRPIVEKQKSYAFYHPFAEALASTVSDIPIKICSGTIFNTVLYFLAGFRYEVGPFFIFLLINLTATITMSQCFRAVASSTKTLDQALSMAGVILLAVVIYLGFVIPFHEMHPWFQWLSYINPLYYAFEAILATEMHGTDFPCSNVVPQYPGLVTGQNDTFVCAERGAVMGQLFVNGDLYLDAAYGYSYQHLWRNFGILCGFLVFFLITNLLAAEFNSIETPKPEALVFRYGHLPKVARGGTEEDGTGNVSVLEKPAVDRKLSEPGSKTAPQPREKSTFLWRDVCLDIKIKGEERRLLDNVTGWVKPGTLTALMGVSGAGKTTLLNVLAQRVSVGVITGDILVNGAPLPASFQRTAGYVQQQDVHLDTPTVREAMRFSALLRQPAEVSKENKFAFVEEVIAMLRMEEFAEAVIGEPGQGLNLEQRKLVSIGVELAAKPALLLFLDEPTSGLDAQSSWAIVQLLRQLADNGQAILCTIHQPSALLFQQFDRLLFLAKGGKTVYFGGIGANSATVLDYFERNGACPCGDDENPAEYLVETVAAGKPDGSSKEWSEIWCESDEQRIMLCEMESLLPNKSETSGAGQSSSRDLEYATPFWYQLLVVTQRVFKQYWRTPNYIVGKFILGIGSALFIGFSFFLPGSSIQGLQMLIFSIFMLAAIFSTLIQQLMPQFIKQRSLYEVRERPSKMYHWSALLIANIVAEVPYQIFLGVLVFAAFSYPVFGIVASESQGLILLFCVQFFVYVSTFGHACIAALPDVETAANIANLAFSMTQLFCGVMVAPVALPGFWVFMYRISPMTYLVKGIVAAAVTGRAVQCDTRELIVFNPPVGVTCGVYMHPYLDAAGHAAGTLLNADATSSCAYCPLTSADQFFASYEISFDDCWRNLGIGFVFIAFNLFATVALYYLRLKTK